MDTQMTNSNKKIFAVLSGLMIAASFLSSCYYDSKEELYGLNNCDTTTVTYSGTILPILQASCLSCHSSGAAALLGGGNNLDGYDNVLNFVEPSDPANSSLYGSVAWIAGYSFMPKSASQLSDCSISKIGAWINSGALND